MKKRAFIALLALSSAAGGCTTHLSSGRPAEGGITSGVVYYLPRVDYDMQVTWILSSCPKQPGDRPEFDVTAKATAETSAGEPVSISYEDLSSLSKTTDFGIELYPTGILKSVNVTVNDHTADIAAEGIKAAVGIAKMVIGVPGLPNAAEATGASEDRVMIGCTEDAAQTLNGMAKQKDVAKTTAGALKTATKAASDFEADHKETSRAAEVVKEADKLATAQRDAQEKADSATKAVADSVSKLTLTAQTSYSPGGKMEVLGLAAAQQGKATPDSLLEFRYKTMTDQWLVVPFAQTLTIANAQLDRAHWQGKDVSADAQQAAHMLWNSANGSPDVETPFVKTTVVVDSFALTRQSSATSSLVPASDCLAGKGPVCGILYRTMAPARVHICRVDTQADVDPVKALCRAKMSDDPALLFAEDRSIPQLGQLASLPFRNGAFQNNTLTAEFSEAGALVKVGYKKPDAEGVAIGKALNNGIDGASSIIAYGTGRELRSLQSQKAIADAQAALATSQASATAAQPTEVTKIDNATKLIQARKSQIEAEIALRQKQAELDALKGPNP